MSIKENMLDQMNLIIHPGKTLLKILEDKAMTVEELAISSNHHVKIIYDIIDGLSNITLEFATKLEEILGLSANYWMELQANYEGVLLEIIGV